MPIFLLLFALFSSETSAAAVASMRTDAQREGDGFALHATAELAVPPEDVFERLADYANWKELSPSIVESEPLPPLGGQERVRSVAHSCVLFFCAVVRQVQEVSTAGRHRVVAVTVPGSGNLRAGHIEWRLRPTAAGTRVDVDAYVVPAFSVPPLVGSWAVKRALRREAIGVFETLAEIRE